MYLSLFNGNLPKEEVPKQEAPEEPKNRIIVVVSGGIVQAVFANDPNLVVDIIDHDNFDCIDHDGVHHLPCDPSTRHVEEIVEYRQLLADCDNLTEVF
jgi:hypothetical protein